MRRDLRFALAFTMMWIHAIVLSSGAACAAQEFGWSPLAASGAWLFALVAGAFPYVRSAVLLILLLLLTSWWRAVLLFLPITFILLMMESMGKNLMHRISRS